MRVDDVNGAQCHGLSVPEVARQLEERCAVLIDLREPAEMRMAGRIPQAIQPPLRFGQGRNDTETHWCAAEFGPRVQTVLYCADGVRSAEVAGILLRFGYPNIAYLQGGMAAWEHEGRPITHLDLEIL